MMTRSSSPSRWLAGCVLGLLTLGGPALSWAQPAGKDKDGFEAVSRPPNMTVENESVPAGPLVAAAYGFIWAAVLVYAGSVAVRARRLNAEVEDLRRKLGKA